MKIIKKAMLCCCFLSGASFGANALLYGIVAGSSLLPYRQIELNAIQTALGKPVEFRTFATYADELRAMQENPTLLSFSYAKQVLVPDISKLKQWKQAAQILTMNHEARDYSTTYSAYLITRKDSGISKVGDLSGKTLAYYTPESISNYIAVKKLLTDNEITGVRWLKAKNIDQAYKMVESGKADAVSLSDYYLINNQNIARANIIYEIKGLMNPIIYMNSSNLNAADIKKVRLALKQIPHKTDADLAYN